MAYGPLRSVIRQLRRIVVAQGGARALSDAQLVEAFLHHRDETAVEMLVWRHGTMVLNLCRRILQDHHDAEDAFQATFLVFVRKAGSIGKGQSIGSWLYKTAVRVAYRLRTRLAKQPELCAAIELLHGYEPADDLIWRDLRSVLDEEIERLPEKYRAPIVLCYLQGHTNEEAAEILRCPKGTILSRLSRGRDQLKSRLTQRGLALSAGWLATHLSVNASSAAMPAALVDSTVKAANAFAAGHAASGLVSSSVAALTQGVLRTMFISRLTKAAVVMMAIAALWLGASSVAQWGLADASHSRQQALDRASNGQDKAQPKKANEFFATIKKVDGNKVTFNRSTRDKKVDDVTLTAVDNVKVFEKKLKDRLAPGQNFLATSSTSTPPNSSMSCSRTPSSLTTLPLKADSRTKSLSKKRRGTVRYDDLRVVANYSLPVEYGLELRPMIRTTSRKFISCAPSSSFK